MSPDPRPPQLPTQERATPQLTEHLASLATADQIVVAVWGRRLRAQMEEAEIEDMFSALGPVTIRRMFGGKGIYHAGRIIAVELRDEMRLKADAVSAPDFEAAGARQWTYQGKAGKTVRMPYWSIPDDAFDDSEIMARWVRLAYEAALRSSTS